MKEKIIEMLMTKLLTKKFGVLVDVKIANINFHINDTSAVIGVNCIVAMNTPDLKKVLEEKL